MSVKGSILVVDDTSESLAMVAETLAMEGYDVRPADSGRLALNSDVARPGTIAIGDPVTLVRPH